MKQLILALDVLDAERAIRIAEDVRGFVDALKVNYPLVLSAGLQIVGELRRIKPVIADFKIADVPHVSSTIAKLAFESGAKAVIVHGFVGSDTVESVLSVAENFGGEVYVVSELSSRGGEEFMSQVSLRIVEMARRLGCHGVVAPATRVERVRRIKEVAGSMKVLCPGIGAQGGSLEVLDYADGIIVGRAIYEAEDPKKAAIEMRKALDYK
ncbi:MAG: orotidine-5'-phosphate decarboxylase [Archaeoglobaceae archaeon]